jgi:maleylacetoacetate isomerase
MDEFVDVNPMVFVPALRIDNHTLIGSLNILQYLEERTAHNPLLPVGDPVKRARVREICDVIASGIQLLQYWAVLNYIGEERKQEWAQHWITRGLKAVETLLNWYEAGLYCVGNDITLADCCLVPQLYNARIHGVDLNSYPVTLRVEGNLKNHPAFVQAHPNNHPICPSEAIPLETAV